MVILFIGDVFGRPGRTAVADWLPALRTQHTADLVVVNAENAAGGLGATPEILQELRDAGADAFTMGNHTWRKRVLVSKIDAMPDVVRPANYPDGVPGRTATVITAGNGTAVGITQVLGRVYLEPYACPFERARREAARLRQQTPVVLVDVHAEATSEKVALGWHLDGHCTAVLGTHTHVQTNDARVLPEGTAYMTDVGMTGPRDGVIGVDRKVIIDRFLTGLPRDFRVAGGVRQLCGAVLDVDETTGRARHIAPVYREDDD